MARPTLDPTEARTERVAFRATAAELARLNDRAARAGMSVSAFARAAATGRELRVIEQSAPDFMTRHELRAIGNNLNQLVRALHRGRDVEAAHVRAVVDKLDRLFDQWLEHGSQGQQARP